MSGQKLIPTIFPIRDDRRIKEVQNFLKKVWSVDSLIPNPVPLPCSLGRQNLELLKNSKESYAVAEKSDGCRYQLVIGTYGDGVPYSVLVDRNLTMYEVKIAAKEDVFKGSVFEGEMVWEKYSRINAPRQEFLVFECIHYMGRDYGTKTFVDRLQVIHDVFYFAENDMNFSTEDWRKEANSLAREGKIVCLGNQHNLKFCPKRCYLLANICDLFKNMGSVRHRTDGLIFTPIYERVRRGRHKSMYKWKYDHTIDLLLRIIYNEEERAFYITAFTQRDGQLVECKGALFSATAGERIELEVVTNEFLKSLLSHLESKGIRQHDVVVECRIEKTDDSTLLCHPVVLRRDKHIPNAASTIELTLSHIEENISVKEIYDIFCV